MFFKAAKSHHMRREETHKNSLRTSTTLPPLARRSLSIYPTPTIYEIRMRKRTRAVEARNTYMKNYTSDI